MCTPIETGSFLAKAFAKTKRKKIKYAELSAMRRNISSHICDNGDVYAVRWTRDALDSVFGFYSDVFRAQSDCVWCDLEKLEERVQYLIGIVEGQKLEQLDECFNV